MTFKHKLSCRLALLRNVVLLGAVCAVAACDLEQLMGLLSRVVVLVSVDPVATTVTVGTRVQLTATPKDATGNPVSGRVVTWASSAPSISVVSDSGTVTGLAAGVATITATSEGQTGVAMVTVQPESTVPVASVTVSPATAGVAVGQTVQLAAVPRDASGDPLSGRVVTWVSSAPALASVNPSGLVTGVGAGAATVTATSEGQSGGAAITVTAPTPGCFTSAGPWQNSSIPSQTGAFEIQFDATPNNANMDAVVGLSNGAAAGFTNLAAIVRFNSTGTIDARNGGAFAAAVAIPYTAGTTYHFRLDVNIPSHSYDIYVTPAGSSEQRLGGGFAFRTEQATVSVLNNLGVFANVGTGSSSVMACNVAVSAWTPPPPAPVASVTVSPASANVGVGAVQQFTATLRDANGNTVSGRTVTWASSALAVATVSGGGLVTALAVGTATITAASEGQSGNATLTVSVAAPGGVVFQSDWSTALGNDPVTALRDGGRWSWEADWGSGKLMSVVTGGPGGRNALKVLQRGGSYGAFVGKNSVLPPSTDYYVRFYMRNDDVSGSGDHIVVPDYQAYSNLTFVRKYGSSNGWRFDMSLYGCSFIYPISHIGPDVTLSNGVWYRFEFYVHFVDPTHIQVHARVYDAAGVQILGDSDFRQEAYGTQVWNGRSDWTLASLYASGYSYCVNSTALTKFAMGNNGQQGAGDTGLAWYYAGLQIRTDRWPGP
jgi:uncharacterized protein YjdB